MGISERSVISEKVQIMINVFKMRLFDSLECNCCYKLKTNVENVGIYHRNNNNAIRFNSLVIGCLPAITLPIFNLCPMSNDNKNCTLGLVQSSNIHFNIIFELGTESNIPMNVITGKNRNFMKSTSQFLCQVFFAFKTLSVFTV